MTTSSRGSSQTSPQELLVKTGKLVLFVVLLPAMLTTLHLAYTLQRHDIVLVEPVTGTAPNNNAAASNLQGMYWNIHATGGGATYQRSSLAEGSLRGWPSVSQIASLLAKRNSQNPTGFLTLEDGGFWCLSNTQKVGTYDKYCTKLDDHVSFQNVMPPKIAEYKPVEYQSGKLQDDATPTILRIRFYHWFKEYYFQTNEKFLQQLFQQPATCLLLALNVGLAWCYWNYRVNPNTVALMDSALLQQYQYWRAITGSLAHFEWWHLLFNMMSLHNLGQFLEWHFYGSINFLLWNLSLMGLTVFIFLMGNHFIFQARVWLRNYAAQQQQQQNNNLHTTSTTLTRPSINAVGYSGVLFAWMVVASLEQPRSCPLPFLDSVCFDTWHLTKHLKFNVGPLIQLVVAQMILPRVSLGGHLAGIVAGFLLHWKLLPLEWVQPSVLLPVAVLVQWRARQFIPIMKDQQHQHVLGGGGRNFLDEAGIDDDDEETNSDPLLHGNESKPAEPKTTMLRVLQYMRTSKHAPSSMLQLLGALLSTMMSLFVISVLMMAWFSSTVISYGLMTFVFYCCFRAYVDHWDQDGAEDSWSLEASQKKQRMLAMWKGFIAVVTVAIVMDSMTLASWMMLGPATFSRYICWVAWALLLARISTNIIAVCVACKHWDDLGGADEQKGVFEYTFSYCVLDNGTAIGHKSQIVWATTRGCRQPRMLSTATPSAHQSLSSSSHHQEGRRLGSAEGSNTPSSSRKLAAAAAERRARATQESELV